MKKIAMMLSCLLCTCMSICAQGFPTISDAETTKWYLIQFTNGGTLTTLKILKNMHFSTFIPCLRNW